MAELTEEVEIIPVSPLRKLEKRIEELEARRTFDSKEFYKELLDIVRINQQIVNELSKANDALRIEISKLPARLDDLTSNIEELISFIKAAAVEEAQQPKETALTPLLQKMDQLIEMTKKMVETNQSIEASIEDLHKKLRRPPVTVPIRKPLMVQKPSI
jgi:regulator of replication initiation timing